MLLVLFVSSLVTYTLLLLASTLLIKTRSKRFRNVLVACLHDTLCIVVPPVVLRHRPIGGAPNLPSETAILAHSCGYFLVDASWFLILKPHDTAQLLHHATCLLVSAVAFLQERGAYDLCLGLFVTHIPSPLAYSVFFRKQLDLHRLAWLDHLYTFVKLVSIGGAGALYIGKNMITSKDTPLASKLGVVSIACVNAVWLLRHLKAEKNPRAVDSLDAADSQEAPPPCGSDHPTG